MTNLEITKPVRLLRPDGRLDPESIGWTRRQLHDTDRVGRGWYGWGRNKRWEYWGIVTPTHIIALTIAGLDFANVRQLWVLDRVTLTPIDTFEIGPFSRGASLTGTHGTGLRFQGIASAVCGLTLVLADGAVLDCSTQVEPEVFQAARVGLGFLQRAQHLLHEAGMAEFLRADIDGQRPVPPGMVVRPSGQLLAGRAQHETAQRQDQARLFGHGDELARRRLDGHVLQDAVAAEGLADAAQRQPGHEVASTGWWRG